MRHENEQPWPELRTVLLPESGEQSDSNDLAMTIRELLHGKAVSRLRKQRWWLKLVNLLKRGHLQIPESLAPRGNARIVTRKEALDIVEKTKREFGLGSVVLSGGTSKSIVTLVSRWICSTSVGGGGNSGGRPINMSRCLSLSFD